MKHSLLFSQVFHHRIMERMAECIWGMEISHRSRVLLLAFVDSDMESDGIPTFVMCL
jgi:hypothetical protein